MSRYSDDWDGYCDMRADAEELRRDEIELAHESAAPVELDPPILCDWHEGVISDLEVAGVTDSALADTAAALARSCDDCEAAE